MKKHRLLKMPKKSSHSNVSDKSAANSSVFFIKGYLPVRLRVLKEHQHAIDDLNDDDDVLQANNIHKISTTVSDNSNAIDESFLYIKEHSVGNSNRDSNASNTIGNNATLFVANCPTVPGISTKLLLQSIFGRYGDVTRVTVIPKPSTTSSNRMSSMIEVPYTNEPYQWTTKFAMTPSYYKQKALNGSIMCDEEETGRFAHVIFSSTKEMKRTFRTLQDIMSSSTAINNSITIDPIEIQTLSDESDRQWRTIQQKLSYDDDDDEMAFNDFDKNRSPVQIVEQQYRMNYYIYKNRESLLQECNAIMEQYEDAEMIAERRQREITSQPDDDGFITVSYNTNVSTTDNLEQTSNNKRSRGSDGITGRRIRTNNKKKKKKGLGGSLPIPDFYRFQAREQKQKSIQDLRERFEQDKLRIQRLK